MTKKIIYNPATNAFESRDPDVAEISRELNKHRRKDDQLPTYDKVQGTFVKGDMKGAMTDFNLGATNLDNLNYHDQLDKDHKSGNLFGNTLNRMKIKGAASKKVNPKRKDNWDIIHATMTPKERRQFYKDKKEKPKDMYDDIPKVDLPKPQIDLKIAENFAEKNLQKQIEEERFKKLMERKEDPDLKRGLGSITYKLIKD